MSAKALIEVDVQIAILGDRAAKGEDTGEIAFQLEALLKRREELIPQMVAERLRDFALAA
jgi:hypothetical protein